MSSNPLVVVPMAGLGSRFAQRGWKTPKPFIDVKGKMMVERVLECLAIPDVEFVLIVRDEFLHHHPDKIEQLQQRFPVTIATVRAITAGAACTVLAARHAFRNRSIVVADSDTLYRPPVFHNFVRDARDRGLAVSLLTTFGDHPAFSYVRIREDGMATEIAEKRVISRHAVCGAYYFHDANTLVERVIDMMIYGQTVNNEYYMSQACQCFVEDGGPVGIYEVSREDVLCMGTPEQLEECLPRL